MDRTNLKRKAHRSESYSFLLSQNRVAIYNNEKNTFNKKPNQDMVLPEQKKVGDCKNKVIKLYQDEFEGTSVMTRSASRKYSTVGAFHNKVNVDKELKHIIHWPENISYAIPGRSNKGESIQNIVSEAFFKVAAFCKFAKDPSYFSKTCTHETVCVQCNYQDLTSLDLSICSTEEVLIDGVQNQFTPKPKKNMVSCQIINRIPSCGEETRVFVEEFDFGTCQLIPLYQENMLKPLEGNHFTETTKAHYLPHSFATLDEGSKKNLTSVHVDHTYALKCNKQNENNNHNPKNEQSIFKLDNALNSLLLNTAILKCLVCGELPQDIASYLNKY